MSRYRENVGNGDAARSATAQTILVAFLADGLTHREIDLVIGQDPNKSKGWVSFGILTGKFKLKGTDRGALFLFGKNEAKRVVKNMILKRSRKVLDRATGSRNGFKILLPYKDTSVLARSPQALQRMLSGEARNAIQRFFESRKRATKTCQMQGCREAKGLDTVHLLRTRPILFVKAARKFGIKAGNMYRFDIHAVMELFLKSHMGLQHVAFLCKKHHKLLDAQRTAGGKTYRALVRTLVTGFYAHTSR